MELSFLLIDNRRNNNQVVFHCHADTFAEGDAMARKTHPTMNVIYGCDGTETLNEIQRLAGYPSIHR